MFMPTNKLTVLITRPENEGQVLAKKLKQLGVATYCQPMFDYQSNQSLSMLQSVLTHVKQPNLIFISVAAVTYANSLHALALWPKGKVFAVGTATAKALKALNIETISPKIQTSEGLLALKEMQNINNQEFIIIRGNGGREHLANSLTTKGSKVYYFESYQRMWRQLPTTIEQNWRKLKINCIVVTSDAILQSIVQLLNLSDGYWQTTCYWLVASERIAQTAKAIGLNHVINTNGANDNAISDAIFSDVIINME